MNLDLRTALARWLHKTTWCQSNVHLHQHAQNYNVARFLELPLMFSFARALAERCPAHVPLSSQAVLRWAAFKS